MALAAASRRHWASPGSSCGPRPAAPWQRRGCLSRTRRRRIWKPIPVRIFYTFVIYQGYDMDILSGKRYDVIYRGYDMDIPNANNLERHILVIYFLTFGQIFQNVIYL